VNILFLLLALAGFGVAAFRQGAWDGAGTAPMEAVSAAMLKAADGAVTLSIGTVGAMALFLGLMKVAEHGGLLVMVARALRPLLVRLFPEVPAGHPAMGAVIFNLSANVLGLGNAATPFGIRAMQQLDRLNPHKGTATDAMVLFLAINTSSVTLLPTSVIALRAAVGAQDPAGIVGTTLFATLCSTAVAIVLAKLLAPRFAVPAKLPGDGAAGEGEAADDNPPAAPAPLWVSWLSLAAVLALVPLTLVWGRQVTPWIIPGLVVGLLCFGAARGVKVYESFVEGAREGFEVGVRIIPYLVAILVVIAMLRESGALDMVIVPLGRITGPLGLPAEVLPLVLLRPLSGSGAFGVLAALMKDPAIGADGYVGMLASTVMGCTETTFYVLAVYFGAVQIRRIRHALVVGLLADAAGVAGAVVICRWVYGG
jgi:spore maturation protein SpmA